MANGKILRLNHQQRAKSGSGRQKIACQRIDGRDNNSRANSQNRGLLKIMAYYKNSYSHFSSAFLSNPTTKNRFHTSK
jgi:hypothetical protein